MTFRKQVTYRRDRGRDRRGLDKAAVLARMADAEEPNPAPWYTYACSAATLAAVYKAGVSVSPSSPFADWRNLSYAVDQGVVFG